MCCVMASLWCLRRLELLRLFAQLVQVGRTLGEGDLLALPEIGVELPLAELYEGLGYEAEPG